MPMAASSSSAWITAKVALSVSGSVRSLGRYLFRASTTLEAGVIGYQPTTVTPPQIVPSAAAVLPSIRILFSLKPCIRSTR